MNNKKTLLFVESPLQLINAIEAISFFKLKDYKIFVRYSDNKRNDLQIRTLLDKFDIQDINLNIIKIAVKDRSFVDFITFIYFYVCIFLISFKRCNIFIGNSESGLFKYLLKMFNRNKIILLDDGNKTFAIQEKFSTNNFYNWFSIFELEEINNQIIYKNKYLLLKQLCNDVNNISNKIIFIGSKIAEEGVLIDDFGYLDMLNTISESYKEDIIYIPHRDECVEKLKKVDLIKNIEVKYIDYPIELYGLIENIIPCKIISFFSTALYSLNIIYPNIPIISYKFDYPLNPDSEDLDSLYESYKSKFKVINI